MNAAPQLEIFSDVSHLAAAGARRFADSCDRAIAERGIFTVALAGGSTPKPLYEILARDYSNALDWPRVHLFWGDERDVPADDRQSNYRMIREAMLDRLKVPAENIHRIPAAEGKSAEDVAQEYDQHLRAFLASRPEAKGSLDLILLGLGQDGHTASLMPDGEPDPFAPEIQKKLVFAVYVPSLKAWRITMSPDFINRGREIVFLVSGREKKRILGEVLRMNPGKPRYPAQKICPDSGKLSWLVDEAAASGFRKKVA